MVKEGGKNEVQVIVNGFQEPKEVPSASTTFDKGVLLIATRKCLSLKLFDWKMQFKHAPCIRKGGTLIFHMSLFQS